MQLTTVRDDRRVCRKLVQAHVHMCDVELWTCGSRGRPGSGFRRPVRAAGERGEASRRLGTARPADAPAGRGVVL